MFDGKAFGAEMTGIVKEFVDRATAPLVKRIEELEARPVPTNGKDGRDGIDGTNGKDGAGVVDVLRNHEGVLIFTLSDGRIKELGNVNGKDGADGKDGLDGRDGEPGKDGKDGFNLEDFDIDKGDDGRTYVFKFDRGDIRHEYELTFPVPVYCGVFKAGEDYVPGDLVTWGGNVWHCDQPTKDKPDVGPWTLAVKKGRDGKDAK